MDLARGLERVAAVVRMLAYSTVVAVVTTMLALDQFERVWGVVPLGESGVAGSVPGRLVSVEPPDRHSASGARGSGF